MLDLKTRKHRRFHIRRPPLWPLPIEITEDNNNNVVAWGVVEDVPFNFTISPRDNLYVNYPLSKTRVSHVRKIAGASAAGKVGGKTFSNALGNLDWTVTKANRFVLFLALFF